MKCETYKNVKEYPSEHHLYKNSHRASHWQTGRRVFFWILKLPMKAALTVEAACVLPLFLFALCTLMSIFDCYRVQSVVKTSLHQSAMELGMYAYASDLLDSEMGVINTMACIGYAKAKLPEFPKHVKVSVAGSRYEDDKIVLLANITYQVPISMIPDVKVSLVNASEVNAWVGYKGAVSDFGGDEVCEMVYVTEHGQVYHTCGTCTYIDREVYSKKKSSLDHSYQGCKLCCEGKQMTENDTVYYTKSGDCYHANKTCSSLIRVVKMVEKSQVSHWSMCSRCESRGTG